MGLLNKKNINRIWDSKETLYVIYPYGEDYDEIKDQKDPSKCIDTDHGYVWIYDERDIYLVYGCTTDELKNQFTNTYSVVVKTNNKMSDIIDEIEKADDVSDLYELKGYKKVK